MIKKILPSLRLFFLLLLFFFIKPPSASAIILFEDNFNDGVPDGWIVTRNPCVGNWEIKNGMYGIKITGGSCVTETMPDNSHWDSSWVDYKIDLDMKFVSGTDKNLAWRYSDPSKWYDVHFSSPNGVNLQRLPPILSGNSSAQYPIPNGHTYHVTVEVKSGNFKLAIDSNYIIDYYYLPKDDRFPVGRVALQASAGSDPVSEVWFDNLVVTSLDEPKEKTPVILLPGFGGSWNTAAITTGENIGSWKKTPFVVVYDNFKNTLIDNAGYVEEDNYFEFYYDWRKPLSILADDFKDYLEDIVLNGKPADTTVNIVGHSMGGVIARVYAQKYGDDKINKLVTVGSPHSGAIKGWEGWSGAEIGSRWSWEWIALQLYLHIHKFNYLSPTQALHNLTPSLHDLSPTFNFAKNTDGTVIDVNSMTDPNLYLDGLNNSISSNLISLLTTIAGHENNQAEDTMEWIKLKERDLVDKLLGKWPDGKPDIYEYTNLGDLTILDKSAFLTNTEQKTVEANHLDLFQSVDGIETILESLEIEATVSSSISSLPRNPSLIFLLHSPANIKVISPNGKEAGFGAINLMNNVIYSPSDKLLVIYDALDGDYQVDIIGNGAGRYDLDIGQLTLNGEMWSTIEEVTTLGEVDTYKVKFNSINLSDNPIMDETGKTQLMLSRYKLEKLKDYVNNQNVTKRDKRKLTSHIDKLIKLIDKALVSINAKNNNQAQKYTRVAMTGCYSLRIKADKLSFDDLVNKNIKEYADEAGKLLLNGFGAILDQSDLFISQKKAKKMLNVSEKVKLILDEKLVSVSGANPQLGYVINLIEKILNKANGNFKNGEFAKSYVQALLSRLLSLEAMRII